MSIPSPLHPPREFQCIHCNCTIKVPWNLPATTGPCPSCQEIITSPAFIPPAPAVPTIPVIAAVPAAATPEKIQPQPAPAAEPAEIREVAPKPLQADTVQEAAAPERKKFFATLSGVVMLIVGVILLIGIGVVVFVLSSKEMTTAPAANSTSPALPPTKEFTELAKDDYIRTGWQKEAYEILENYMAGTTSAEKLPFIRNGPALASKLEDFYGGGVILDSDTPADAFSVNDLTPKDYARGLFMLTYDQPPHFDVREFFRPLASLEVQYGVDEADLLLSMVARAGNFSTEPLRVQAFFKRTPEGLKLDWEVFAQTKYRTFKNFVEFPKLGEASVFRVVAMEDVPEKGRDVAGSRSYRLLDPANLSDNVRINVPIDSDVGRSLAPLNWRDIEDSARSSRTATLELKWSGDENAPLLEISRFVCWEFLGLGGKEAAPGPPTE